MVINKYSFDDIKASRSVAMSVLLQIVILASITGVVAIILGGVLGFSVLPDSLDGKLHDNVRLELSDAYKQWSNPPYDITTNIYFFDVKNARDVMNGENASLERKGPIIYKQRRTKENIHYNSKRDTYTYDEMVSHTYDQNSPLKETDSVYTLNILKYMSLGYCEEVQLLNKLKGSFKKVFEDTPNEDIFHSITIKDFLIDGYECLRDAAIDDGNAKTLKATILSKLKSNPRLQKNLIGYRFFPFRPEQQYNENIYEMQGGANTITSQGNIVSINGAPSLTNWPDSNDNYCNSIRGTDSRIFPPDFKAYQGLFVYDNDLCRSLDYSSESEIIVSGFKGVRMMLNSENFEYSEEDNRNTCFCVDSLKCPGDGFLNLETCIKGISMIASQPYFHNADPIHAEKLNFQPNIEEDISFIDIETESGTILRASKKIQYNMWIKNFKGFTGKVQPFMLPLFLVEEHMQIPEEVATKLNDIYFHELIMIEGVKWGLLGAGIALIVLSIGIFLLSTVKFGSRR